MSQREKLRQVAEEYKKNIKRQLKTKEAAQKERKA